MNKYIQDSIRNNSRSILKDLTKPQRKAISEVIRGLFTKATPILRHLAQDLTKTAKKQGEKYAYHLGGVDLTKKVDDFAMRRIKQEKNKTTIIAYDLTDISKPFAKKMEGLTKVWDGSQRKVSPGYSLHGVGINNLLVKLQVHPANTHTINQIRRQIVSDLAAFLDYEGIWVFDRGNDSKAFFKFLRHKLNLQFIARLKVNRQVVIKKTGVLKKIENLKPGRYRIYLMDHYNNKVDTRYEYTLVIDKHLKNKPPIRLLCHLKKHHSKKQIVTMYLERWGVENLFKRTKQKFNLEKIRVLDHQKFVNVVSLIQLAVLISTITFIRMQQATQSLITGVLLLYKKFIHLKNLSQNVDSFISFMQSSLKPLKPRNKPPPDQLNLFSRRQLEKMGSF